MAFRWESNTKRQQIKARFTWQRFGKKINWFQPKNELKRRAHDLKEPRCKLGSNTRIQFDSNESKFGPWTPSKVGLSIEVQTPLHSSSHNLHQCILTAMSWGTFHQPTTHQNNLHGKYTHLPSPNLAHNCHRPSWGRRQSFIVSFSFSISGEEHQTL